MKRQNHYNIGCNISLSGVLTTLFIVLKLIGVINWNWILVFSPTIASTIVPLSIIGIMFAVKGILSKIKEFKEKSKNNKNDEKINTPKISKEKNNTIKYEIIKTDNDVKEIIRYEELTKRQKIQMLKKELQRLKKEKNYIDNETKESNNEYTLRRH